MSKSKRKGKFAAAGMPVAPKYPTQLSRRGMIWLGLAAVAAVSLGLVGLQVLGGASWATRGPLSSAHAVFAEDCSSCHAENPRKATDERCSSCHEKYGDDLGVYSHAAHYIYRSDDFRRLAVQENELECSVCHVEHEGREADLTRVTDRRCAGCHFDSFGAEHPQFDFVAEAIPDPAGLVFPHARHVGEVMSRHELEDLERACLFCHNAQDDGRSFEPVSFDRHCDSCHLTSTIATPGLPVAGGPEPGVETLEEIADRGGPDARWAYFTNPNEFRRRGDLVIKAPLHHPDPWIMSNLRRLRRTLYPDAGLADLLAASAEVPAADARALYEEAIATLESQATGLRGRPEREIQQDLRRIESALESLRRKIADPYATFDETEFLLALEHPDPDLGAAERQAIERLVGELTAPCRLCHLVEDATITRVQKDQRVLGRAEFNHRAHVVQARCLDCHTAIEMIPAAEDAERGGGANSEAVNASDRASVQNVPAVELCRECHAPRRASDRCSTCHLFHPDKSRRSQLLLYLDEPLASLP